MVRGFLGIEGDEYMEKPQAITAGDRFFEYWMERMCEEQARTNKLLLQLLGGKPNATRKKKEEDNRDTVHQESNE